MEIAIIGIAILAALAIILDWFLRKVSTPKAKVFPTCRHCKRHMPHRTFSQAELPYEMRAYLYKWQLPDFVIRKHVCPNFHNELWIAPAVADMDKSLFVARQL